MALYRVYIDGKKNEIDDLDPEQALYGQLRTRFKLPEKIYLRKHDADEQRELLGEELVLSEIPTNDASELYIYTSQIYTSRIDPPPLPPWLPLALAALVVAVIGFFAFSRFSGTGPTAALTAPTTSAPVATATAQNTPAPAVATATAQNTPAPAGSTPTPEATTASAATPRTVTIEIPPGQVAIAVVRPLNSSRVLTSTVEGMLNAAQMAYADHNALLESEGLTITLTLQFYSDQGEEEPARVVAQDIVSATNTLCVVGHYTSDSSKAAKTYYKRADLLMIPPSNTAPDVTDSEAKVYRVVGTDRGRGAAAAKFAAEQLEATSAFIFADNSRTNYLTASNAFADEGPNYGISIPDALYFKSTDATIENQLQQLQDALSINQAPDVIFFVGDVTSSIRFVPEIRAAGFTGPIIGADSMDTPEFAALNNLGELYSVTVALPNDLPDGRPFAEAYTAYIETLGGASTDVPTYAPETYDATYLCMRAIIEAAKEVGGVPTRGDVLAAMRTLAEEFRQLPEDQKDQPEMFGDPYIFDENGDIAGVYFVRKIADGTRTTLPQTYRCTTSACTDFRR